MLIPVMPQELVVQRAQDNAIAGGEVELADIA
jgi:hypothetical protein